MGDHYLYIVARGIRRVTDRPYLVGGMAMIAAYLHAWLRGEELLADASVVHFVRRTQMQKLSGLLRGEPVHK